MLVMSCPSATNEPESCSSEGSSCTTSSITTSDPSSMSGHTHTTLPSLSDDPDTSKHEAPPPPPLPPAPPPPPPPANTSTNHRKKRRVRSFFWKPIPEEKVRGKPNIWTMSVRQQQQYQIDVRSVEELFGQQEEAATGVRGATQAAGTSTRLARSRSFKESSKDEINILDSKRGMNVGIFLKQFKKSNLSIVEDIRQGQGKIYGAELLKDLLKLLPDVEEIKKLQAFKGDPDKLTLVDSFMFLLIQVPQFEVRIEAIVLREEFFPSCAVMSREIDVVRVATKELMSCEELHAILHLVLQAGNIMNAGGYAGNAVGFKLSSLLSLADTKANKPGMNLLHFVAMEAKKKDEKLLKFPEKLQDVQSAARISVENIEVEFSSLYVRIKCLEEKVQGDPELLQQLELFLQSAAQTLQDLKRRRLDLRKEGNALIDFFCEDKDTFKLDECFRIFQDFCIKFKKAVKDNVDRELKEAARQRRLQELEEKRFAWSEADQSGGFGRSSSENDVEMLTKEGLLDFFQQRSQSPHSPLGRSASARRHRHTLTSIADRELQGYLELLGGAGNPTDYSKFNSLPRSGRAVQRRTTPWISAQDDNRELGCDRQVMSPHAETEPISPLARFSSSGINDNEPYNNNIYSSISEGSALPRPFCVFQTLAQPPDPTVTGHMNVSVEKHTLVRGPQAFDLPSPNNNTNHMHFVNQGDVVVSDLEKEARSLHLNLDLLLHDKDLERGAYPKAAWGGKIDPPAQDGVSPEREEEDNSTVSSTTCDTPLPLDTSVSNKKPTFYIPDCTETDCSVTSDYSEVESASLTKDGLHIRTTDRRRTHQESQRDPSSLSSNFESLSPNEQSVSHNELSKSVDAASMNVSATTEEWDTESCDTAEGKQGAEKEAQGSGRKPAHAKSKANKATKSKSSVRTLTSSESQGMRKVVPISKLPRAGSSKRAEKLWGHEGGESSRPLRDQSTPARGRSEKASRPPRHSSLPPDESKAQRGSSLTGGVSRWARDLTPRKASVHKPSAKPVRNIPKPVPEEKMCRSTMRALAQAQAKGGASSDNSSCHTLNAKNSSDLPNFARNTVASTSRTKLEPAAPSVPSTPSRSPSLHGRQTPATQNKLSPTVHSSEERPQGTNLRRVQSVKATSRSAYRSETPPPPPTREDIRKASIFSEKSVQSRDLLMASRGAKPSWK
ncbi:LOW QUALITY PROTEIN: FH2 domain-containing protein 1 [Cottoperca gobio]|uniref:LOW QUALITY PROTEIN: FH2 domain-containing protein 1 n=1 Tax=Cottoperca gobio TaxID=56716 RepID=A0A6J2Q916_COTGO|nr:LOW QUALITY PROTEIN: FH2 domain-containing protein 1 [Cottoperca gobio]